MKSFAIKILKDQSGLNLIEVMVGICILSVGLLGVAAMQTSVVRNNKTGNTFSQANALACTQLEQIKNGDIMAAADILNPAVLPTTTSNPNNPVDENGDPGGIYNVSWTVAQYLEDTDGDGVVDTPSAFGRTVTVTVSFPFAGDGMRQVEFTSVVAGGGI